VDRMKAMQTFVRIVEAKSFSRAAETLALPRASLTATMQNLEAYLGRKLLQRTTRSVSLTTDGAAYYERCLAILAAVDDAEATLRGDEAAPQGRLRIELPATLGRSVVIPRLAEFHRAYPQLALVVGMSDRLADLTRDGVDCALRVGALQDSTLVGRQIGSMRFITCAAPAYLERHGMPRDLEDLKRHQVVLHFSGRTGRAFDWEFLLDGETVRVDVDGPFSVNDADANLNLGLQGLGIVQAATYQVRAHLQSGALVAVLPALPCPPMPISLVYQQGHNAAPKMRAFTRWLEGLFDEDAELRR
jgi:LysR family transcriptional regulator for bpeEF and oprC